LGRGKVVQAFEKSNNGRGVYKNRPHKSQGTVLDGNNIFRDAIQFLHLGLKVFEVLACTGKKKMFGVMVG
jgi:hypothetical protein